MRSKPWLDNWSPFDHTLFSFLSPPSPEFAIAANNTNPALVIVPNRTNHAVVDDSVSKVLQKVKEFHMVVVGTQPRAVMSEHFPRGAIVKYTRNVQMFHIEHFSKRNYLEWDC